MAIPLGRPRLAPLSVLLLLLVTTVNSLQLTYCANENTATKDGGTTIYQSLGNCKSMCANYAFAVVQNQNCWCANNVPSSDTTVNLSQCSDTCPGYPFENCGNGAQGLYGYLALSDPPTGTGMPSPQSAVGSASPITTQQVQTIGGQVTTATVTLRPTAAAETTSKKMSSGSVVAIAVASVVAAIVLLTALLVGFCCWRRRRDRRYDDDVMAPEVGQLPRRNTSVMSNAGLLGPSSGSNSTTPPRESPPRGARRPPLAGPIGAAATEQRNSRLMVFDQRLNPTAFMQHDDGSRASFVSMQDNRDYTRTLNIRNPDPAD